jgi:hypothetical protein
LIFLEKIEVGAQKEQIQAERQFVLCAGRKRRHRRGERRAGGDDGPPARHVFRVLIIAGQSHGPAGGTKGRHILRSPD